MRLYPLLSRVCVDFVHHSPHSHKNICSVIHFPLISPAKYTFFSFFLFIFLRISKIFRIFAAQNASFAV